MKTRILLTVVAIFMGTLFLNAQNNTKMEYTFSKEVNGTLEEVTAKLTAELEKVKFGIITQVEMDKKLKEKLDVDIPAYRILGVCSPKHAYEAMKAEENIGVFLPCKIIIKEIGEGKMEVVSIDPNVMMKMLGNAKLDPVAEEVAESLRKVIDAL